MSKPPGPPPRAIRFPPCFDLRLGVTSSASNSVLIFSSSSSSSTGPSALRPRIAVEQDVDRAQPLADDRPQRLGEALAMLGRLGLALVEGGTEPGSRSAAPPPRCRPRLGARPRTAPRASPSPTRGPGRAPPARPAATRSRSTSSAFPGRCGRLLGLGLGLRVVAGFGCGSGSGSAGRSAAACAALAFFDALAASPAPGAAPPNCAPAARACGARLRRPGRGRGRAAFSSASSIAIRASSPSRIAARRRPARRSFGPAPTAPSAAAWARSRSGPRR